MQLKPLPIEDILSDAIDIADSDARCRFVDGACGGDDALRHKVERLIANHFRAGCFLETPVVVPAAGATTAHVEGPSGVIGPYRLLEQIGEGGFGIVFMAEQQHPVRRKVALKIIKPGMDTRQVIARFEAERQALALMDHPNIAKVLDAGATESGQPYFVMELIKGAAITDYCDENRLPPRERLRLFVSVCQAVQHAHQKGIIHRDIKPSNVLITLHDGTPVVKVIDFGIAKATGQQLTERTLFTHFAQMMGTPLYMSPEQAALGGLDIDTRCDVYSLGVLFYELLTGTTPFTEERLREAGYDEMRRLIREEEPSRPSMRLSTLGQAGSTVSGRRQCSVHQLHLLLRGELDWIVMKSLEKDRNRRYESASALAADVDRHLNDEPVQACPPSTTYRLRKWGRRNKLVLTATSVIATALLLGGGSVLWWAAKSSAVQGEARAALQEAWGLHKEEKWSLALNAIRRAQGFVAGVGGDGDLRERIDTLAKDLELACKIEETRVQNTLQKDGDDEVKASDAAFAAAFAGYGLEVDRLRVEEAAERIQASSIGPLLAIVLDEWAEVRVRHEDKRWRHLVAIARLADPDPWRNKLRDALGSKDPVVLMKLANSVNADELAPTTAVVLSRLVPGMPARNKVLNVLRRVHDRHPDDFWLNHQIGYLLLMDPQKMSKQAQEALRYLQAAVALRPLAPGVRLRFGLALDRSGFADQALFQYREAIRLKPDFETAFLNLGALLQTHYGRDKLPEAITAYRKAIEIDPRCVKARNNLGLALLASGAAPASADDRLAMAILCGMNSRFTKSTRFSSEAFAADPNLVIDPYRRLAASTAALAGCAQGEDAGNLEPKEYARLRGQALDWLRDDLTAWRAALAKNHLRVRKEMLFWQQSPDFNGVRGAEALAKLPEVERLEWQKLWQDVDALARSAED